MNWLTVFAVFSLFGCLQAWRFMYRGRLRKDNVEAPVTDYPTKFFEQNLDHFNPVNSQKWKQKYYVNETFYKPGGPVFLMIGGEGAISPPWMMSGAWLIYARKYNALCIMVEHRYYGESHPTEDLSVKNLVYLNSEQALADLAYFIVSFNKELNVFPTPKWITFGGSYPGSLAVWMRLKYPHLVHGAVSSSGPLLAQLDFKEYFQVVKDSLSAYNPGCVTAIEKGTEQILSFLSHPLGQKKVEKLFKLCDPLDLNNKDDESNLFESLADNFAGIVQYNKNNRRKKDPNELDVTIDYVCDILLNKTIGSEIIRLAAVNDVILNKTKEPCLDYKYEKMINEMRETKWDSKVAEGTRQWTYQTCTEFGFFQTSALNSTQKMFGNAFPAEFFIKQCTDVFGPRFNSQLAKEGIDRTNFMYGGMDDHANNVVYIHGSVDPWHVLGITKTLREGAPAIYIQGAAHCANMYEPTPRDPPELVAARRQIESLIGEWLKQ